MNTSITNGIKVSVFTKFRDKRSEQGSDRYLFSYYVSIKNMASYPVQLLRRFWFIEDSKTYAKKVEGEGVIGEQPIIQPGEEHAYESWSPISSSIGRMSGHYTMINLHTKEEFTVEIPDFQLVADFMLN